MTKTMKVTVWMGVGLLASAMLAQTSAAVKSG